mgnify:CR=1 FL=1
MAKLVSKTYGDALFELALEENKIDSLQEEVVVVLEALAENQDLSKLMNHPKIAKEEKTEKRQKDMPSRLAARRKMFNKINKIKDADGKNIEEEGKFFEGTKYLKVIYTETESPESGLNFLSFTAL